MEKSVPVFVKLDNYREILDVMDVMKKKVKETRTAMQRVRELKAQEDAELAEWEKNIGEVAKRLAFVDASFFDSDL